MAIMGNSGIETNEDSVDLALPAVLDLRAAEALAQSLRDALAAAPVSDEGARSLTLDAKRVRRLSTACIQVLMAAGTAITASGGVFRLRAPSEALIAAFEDLGLFAVLMGWKITA